MLWWSAHCYIQQLTGNRTLVEPTTFHSLQYFYVMMLSDIITIINVYESHQDRDIRGSDI